MPFHLSMQSVSVWQLKTKIPHKKDCVQIRKINIGESGMKLSKVELKRVSGKGGVYFELGSNEKSSGLVLVGSSYPSSLQEEIKRPCLKPT